MPNIVMRIERAAAADVAALARFGSATIHEAQGRLGAISSRIRPIDRGMSLCGSAFTVESSPRDNIMLQLVIHYAEVGDVIVVSAGEYAEAGSFGGVLGNACVAKGIAGVVTDTCVRDTAELIALGLPVFSLRICIRGTVKETLGRINREIVFGGEIVRQGDVIRRDADGLVVVRREDAALETHFGKPLLLRSKRGVVPTEAGKLLYKHCQLILKQMDQAEIDITSSGTEVSGLVSVGLAPLSLGSLLATQLMKTMRREHPGIVLHINENVGGVISELVINGKMDLALIYDPGGIPGVTFDPVRTEELYFVTTRAPEVGDAEMSFADAVSDALILPSAIHTVRQVIDTTPARAGLSARVVARTESISLLANAIGQELGSTILPLSAARALQRRLPEARRFRIRQPNMKVHMAICVSDQLPMSEPAAIVLHHLADLDRSTSDALEQFA